MMTDDQMQDIADRVIEALNNLAPGEPAPWEIFAAFAPFSALVAAFLIAGVAWRTLKQKRESDNRSEWWKRTQWALDATTSEDPVMIAYGEGMLKLLVESTMANKEDKQVLDAIWTKSETSMDDDNIEQLINELVAARDLTEEQRSSVEGFIDGSTASGDNEPTEEERIG